jgi:hypothetical protein
MVGSSFTLMHYPPLRNWPEKLKKGGKKPTEPTIPPYESVVMNLVYVVVGRSIKSAV